MEVEIDYDWFIEEVEKARKKGADTAFLGANTNFTEEQDSVMLELIVRIKPMCKHRRFHVDLETPVGFVFCEECKKNVPMCYIVKDLAEKMYNMADHSERAMKAQGIIK